MTLDGAVLGRLIAHYDHPRNIVEHADLWVLRILADQAAVSMHTATLYATGADLRLKAQQLYDEIARNSQDLETRTAELERAERRLRVLHQRELLDAERHRIALELHDSVAQFVLSAGLAVEVCRAEAADRDDGGTVARLTDARDLIAKAGDQVRSVIYALNHEPSGGKGPVLPELLKGLAAQHRPKLSVTVRLEGRPQPISAIAEHALARIAGEALFNVSLHAEATRAVVRLRYAPQEVVLSIGDDGRGDPAQLRRLLRLEAQTDSDGRHQGLANMARRTQDLGGSFTVRRSKLGGIRLDARIPAAEPRRRPCTPVPMTDMASPDSRPELIELVLVDDHAVVRQGLRSILERAPDVRVVGEAGTPDEAMKVVAASRPSLVLLDLKLSSAPGLEGLDLCAQLVAAHPGLAVLVLTTTLEDSLVVTALRNGAKGYVVKEVDTSELLRAIRAVHQGENAFDPRSSSAMVRGLTAGPPGGEQMLTAREIEVLRLLARGMSNRDIGRTLFIAETTAKFHVANIMRKLDVGRRSEAVYVASQLGAI